MREGERLVEAAACRRCHTVNGRGTGLATDLGPVAATRDAAELVAAIVNPVDAMPRFGFDAPQAEAIVAFLLHTGADARTSRAYRVHFASPAASEKVRSVFEEKCGGCHRLLSAAGPRGHSRAGPDLSGLFSAFHPGRPEGRGPWTRRALEAWLDNPRATRPGALMPPTSRNRSRPRR